MNAEVDNSNKRQNARKRALKLSDWIKRTAQELTAIYLRDKDEEINFSQRKALIDTEIWEAQTSDYAVNPSNNNILEIKQADRDFMLETLSVVGNILLYIMKSDRTLEDSYVVGNLLREMSDIIEDSFT